MLAGVWVRRRAEPGARRAAPSLKSQGWPRIFKLAQQSDWKSVYESRSWPKVRGLTHRACGFYLPPRLEVPGLAAGRLTAQRPAYRRLLRPPARGVSLGGRRDQKSSTDG
jgi:hypothetical protein